jgi:Zn-dependent metalloprotease
MGATVERLVLNKSEDLVWIMFEDCYNDPTTNVNGTRDLSDPPRFNDRTLNLSYPDHYDSK